MKVSTDSLAFWQSCSYARPSRGFAPPSAVPDRMAAVSNITTEADALHQRETLNSEPSAALHRLERHHKAFVKRLEGERNDEAPGASALGNTGDLQDAHGAVGGNAGSSFQDDEEFPAPWYIFFPDSSFRLGWDCLAGLLIVYIAIATPLALAFDEEFTGDGNFLPILDVAIDIFFIFDIVLNFFTAVEQEDSQSFHTDMREISGRYLAGWFTIDVVSGLPVSVFLLFLAADAGGLKGLRLIRVIKLSRVVKLLQNERFAALYEVLESEGISINPAYGRLTKLTVGLALIWHWIACFYWLISSTIGFGTTAWVPSAEVADLPLVSRYANSYFWALVATSGIGYDIEPSSEIEVAFTCFVIMVGLLISSVIIGSVSQVFSQWDIVANKRKEKLDFLNSYLRMKEIPQPVIKRVRNYYRYLESSQLVDTSGVLTKLPPTLMLEVSFCLHSDLLEKCVPFRHLTPACLAHLIEILKHEMYLPGDYVCVQGEPGHSMFFISRGICDVIIQSTAAGGGGGGNTGGGGNGAGLFGDRSDAGEESEESTEMVVAQMTDGACFGELSLLYHEPRSATIRANVYTETAQLKDEDFNQAMVLYPDLKRRLVALSRHHICSKDKRRLDAYNAEVEASGELPPLSPVSLRKNGSGGSGSVGGSVGGKADAGSAVYGTGTGKAGKERGGLPAGGDSGQEEGRGGEGAAATSVNEASSGQAAGRRKAGKKKRQSVADDISALLGKLDEEEAAWTTQLALEGNASRGGLGISRLSLLAAVDKSAAELYGRTVAPRSPPTLKQVQARIGGAEVWRTLETEEKKNLLKQAHDNWLLAHNQAQPGLQEGNGKANLALVDSDVGGKALVDASALEQILGQLQTLTEAVQSLRQQQEDAKGSLGRCHTFLESQASQSGEASLLSPGSKLAPL